MNTKEILTKARELIEAGWIQGNYRLITDVDGRIGYCVLGALREVFEPYNGPETAEMTEAVELVRIKATGTKWGSLSVWNDAPGRAKEEVLAVLDKAIEAAE